MKALVISYGESCSFPKCNVFINDLRARACLNDKLRLVGGTFTVV